MNALVNSPTGGDSVTVAVSGTFDIQGQSVTINSQDITNIKSGINFTLGQPVTLGTIDDFIDWLNKTFSTPLTSKQLDDAIDKLPSSPAFLKDIRDALLSFLHATITITMLSINTQTKVYQFGVTVTPNPPISILGLLELDSIGVAITSGVTGSP